MNDNWGFSDEELDGLFRQAADGQRPRFEPEDWRNMAARLDEAGRDGMLPPNGIPWYRRWGWLVLTGVLLLTGLTVWLSPTSDRPEATRPTNAPARSATKATNPNAPAASLRRSAGNETTHSSAGANEADEASRMNTPATPAAASGATDSETRRSLSGAETGNAENQTTADRTAQSGSEQKSVGRGSLSDAPAGEGRSTGVVPNVVATKKVSPSKNPNPALKRLPMSNPPMREVTAALQNRTAKPTRRLRENAPVVAGNRTEPDLVARRTNGGRPATLRRQENGPELRRESGADLPLAEAAPEATTEATPDRWQTPSLVRLSTRRLSFRKINLPVEEPTLSQFSSYYTPPVRRAEVLPRGRLGVRALLAPDFNAVSAMKTFAYGRSVGLLAEYEFLPRWRLQAGAIRSQKDYGSTPADYTPPTPGYWARWGKPETIDARCAILDVPLNVRFDALRRPRHDLFVSTGVSTYVMLDEFYDYNYSYKPPYTHAVHRGGRHLASTLNLSAGYERQLGVGFSLQVEPYLKLPLAGIGWGSVRLYSTGLHLSLGFHRVR